MTDFYVDLFGDRKIYTTDGKEVTKDTKIKKKTGFFQTPELFKDGYQFGDVLGTVFGTAVDTVATVGKGAGKFVEGMGDSLLYGASEVADFFGADSADKWLKSAAKTNIVDNAFAPIDNTFGKSSIWGDRSSSVLEGVGQIGAMLTIGKFGKAAGLGTLGTTGLTAGTMFASSTGSGLSEAYQSGATDGEAWTYGLLKGGIDASSEMLFGGLGKFVNALGFSRGISSLDDAFAKKVSSKISNRVLKNAAEFGIKASGEGLEEVIAGYGSAVAKKLTYASDEELKKLVDDEDLLEQFIVGAMTSGIVQSPQLYSSTKNGTDFVTGYTKGEESVVEAVVQKRVEELKAEGKQVSKRDVSKIYDEVKNSLEKGYIDTDTIESVIGGDEYKSFKDLEKKLEEAEKEYDKYHNMPHGEKTDAIDARQKELASEIESLKKQVSEAREPLFRTLDDGIKGTRLSESYREGVRASEKFEADLSQYENEFAKKTIENYMARNFNNTNRSHDRADFMAKLAEDRGRVYGFTTTAELEASIKEGNPYGIKEGTDVSKIEALESEKNGVILVNMDANKSFNSLIGHETTHTMEKAGLYGDLQEAVYELAKSRGEYDDRLKSIRRRYANLSEDEQMKELTADLLGDYIFASDPEFVMKLSTERPNLFKRILEEIKHLFKLATSGSDEARQLENARHLFEKAWRDRGSVSTNTKAETKLSSADSDKTYLDAVNRGDMDTAQKMVDEVAKKAGAYVDSNGNIVRILHGTNMNFNTFDAEMTHVGSYGYGYYFSSSQSTSDSYGKRSISAYLMTNRVAEKGNHNITANQVREFLRAYDREESNTTMYRFDSTEEYLKQRDDLKVITDLHHWAREFENDKTTADVLNDTVNILGYDAMHRDGINYWVVYDNKLIKSADAVTYDDAGNVIPLSERFNTEESDIRYSLTDSDGNQIESERVSSNEYDVKYSLAYSEDIAKGQMSYLGTNEENAHVTEEELREAQKITNAMVDVMMKYSSILPEDKIGKVLTNNGSYDKSVENTTICVRTLAYNEFVDKVQEELGRPMTQMESFLVSQKLYDIAAEPQCLYCYVSLDRKAFNDMLLRYMGERDTVIAKYNKSDKSQEAIKNLYTEFLRGRKDTPQMKSRFNKWISYADNGTQLLSLADIATESNQSKIQYDGGVLAEQLKDARQYAQSASWSKIQKNYVAYKDEILKLKDKAVRDLNEHYGLRWYSFSDYSPAFIVENMQQITDAAIRGLKGLAYTKDTDFAEIFAPSGMNINISVFVNTDENGNFYIDERQSANLEKAIELRDRFPNVGIVATVTNDEALRWAGEQSWSDVIIPFHIVRTGTDVAEFYKWLNYTDESGDKVGNKDLWDAYLDSLNLKSEKARKKVSKNIYPSEHKNNKDTYVNLCESRGLTPRFVRFVGEDWYMKLVNETRLSADESSVLKPIYNEEVAKASFERFVEKGGYDGGWYKEGVDVDAEASIVANDILAGKKANEVDYGRQDIAPVDLMASRKANRQHGRNRISDESDNRYSIADSEGNQLTEGQQEFFKDSKARDDEGKLLVGYHGTDKAGFTTFDFEKGKGRTGFGVAPNRKVGFFTTSKRDADSYGGNDGKNGGKVFDPKEVAETHNRKAEDHRVGEYLRFDTKEDADAFLKKYPMAKYYIPLNEVYSVGSEGVPKEYAEEKGIDTSEEWWEDEAYDEWKDDCDTIFDAYRTYEAKHTVSITIKEFLDNPQNYSLSDLRRAMDAYDENNAFYETISEGYSYEEMVDFFKDTIELDESEGYMASEISFFARPLVGQDYTVTEKINRRTYACHFNLKNPLIKDYEGRYAENTSFYSDLDEAIASGEYDGFIAKNCKVGRYKDNGTIICPFSPNQVKLIDNASPTDDADIRNRIADDDLYTPKSYGDTSTAKDYLVKEIAPTVETAQTEETSSVEDIAPIFENEATSSETSATEIAPLYAAQPNENVIDGQLSMFEEIPVKKSDEAVKSDSKKSRPEQKQRKWVGTSTESEVVDGKVLPKDLDQDLIHYQPIPNKKTLGNANASLERMGYDTAVQYFNSQFENKKVSLDDIALGERLIQEAVKREDYETASNLIQNVSILGTELGQKVQALSIIKRLSPEGQLKMLQKTVERGKAKGDKAFEGVEITQEMIDHILKTYGKDGTYDQKKLNKAVEEVKQKIADQMKVTPMEKANAWRYLSMLGNPKTHIRNLVSNVAMRGTLAVKNAVARTIEGIAPIKNRTKTWKASSDAVNKFAELTTNEMKDEISGNSKYSDDASIKQKREIFKNKILNGVYEFNSNMLEKEDWWFSNKAFKESLAEYLTANGIVTEQDIAKNPKIVAKAKAYALEQAQIATFRQYSWLANKINEMEKKNTATSIAVGAILPFKKTPVNIAKTGLSYSPLGFMKTLTYDIAQVRKGNMEASELVDHLSQNVTGTALTLVGYMLASSGLLSGGGEDDKEGKYDYQLGEQAYSVNIDGNSYSLSWLSPVAMPLFVGANAYEQLVEGKEWNGDVVVETLSQTLDPLSEMSFLSSLDDVLSSYDSGVEKFAGIAESMAQNYITQFAPTIMSQVATVTDDKKRSTKVGGDSGFKFFDETINKLKYKIPGLRQTLEPSTDIWGNEVTQTENLFGRAFETFIAPYSKRENIATDIDEEIKSVYRETGDNGIIPNVPYNYTNYGGEKYKMSESEYTQYKKTYGQTASSLLDELFGTETYKASTSEDKAKMINDVYDYAADEAKRELLAQRGIDYTNAESSGTRYYRENPIKGAIEMDISVDEYNFSNANPEKYAFFKDNGMYDNYASADEEGKRAYNWAYENPGKYEVSKVIADNVVEYRQYTSGINDVRADKYENGKTIPGSAKEKKIAFINGLDLDYGQKIILYRSEYSSDDTYNNDIVEYLNNREDISYDEMVTILKELGFSVSSDGTVSW